MSDVVIFTADLNAQTRIAGAVKALGFESACRREVAAESLVDSRLAVVDLSTVADAAGVVALAGEQHPPPPCIAFGPHVHKKKLAAAKQAGCTEVFTQGEFYAGLSENLRRYL